MIKINKTVILDLNDKKNRYMDRHSCLGESVDNFTDIKIYNNKLKDAMLRSLDEGIRPISVSNLKILNGDLVNYRYPWKDIQKRETNQCSLAFTLNPDVRVDFDVRDKKVVFPLLLDIFKKLKENSVCKKIISNYEYGEKGKEHGKLHFHGIVQFDKPSETKRTNREIFEKELLKVFNKRSNVSDRTLHTKLLRTQDDKDRYLKYLQKEQQCKIKTLCYVH